MIDTDKYERILKATYSTDSIRCDTLLAHGLHLLAEVKRLREWENRIRTYFGDEEMMDFYDWMKEKYGEEK